MDEAQKQLIFSKDFLSTNLFKVIIVAAAALVATYFVLSSGATPCTDGDMTGCKMSDNSGGLKTCTDGEWSDCAAVSQPDCDDDEEEECTTEEGDDGYRMCDNGEWGECYSSGNNNLDVCNDGDSIYCSAASSCAGTKECVDGEWGTCIKTDPNCPLSTPTCTTGTSSCFTNQLSQTDQNCSGLKVCSGGVWGSCADTRGDNCPIGDCNPNNISVCYSLQNNCKGLKMCNSSNAWGPCVDDPTDACTEVSACTIATQATACNDSKECTADACPSGTCVHANVTDSTACTGGTCWGGECIVSCSSANASTVCNDHNECTTDSCTNAVSGICVNTKLTGTICGTGGTCQAGTCVAPGAANPDVTSSACNSTIDVTAGDNGIKFDATLFDDPLTNFGYASCCGNNASEYYICYKENYTGTPTTCVGLTDDADFACCQYSTDCIDGVTPGKCFADGSSSGAALCSGQVWDKCNTSGDVGGNHSASCCTSVANGWKTKTGLTEKTWGTCSDGKDNDCDGLIDTADSDCPCIDGATVGCDYTDGCDGTQTCSSNAWGACVKNSPPTGCPVVSPDTDAVACEAATDMTPPTSTGDVGIEFGENLFDLLISYGNFGTPNCCGDDTGEYYMCYRTTTAPSAPDCTSTADHEACCSSSTDCVSAILPPYGGCVSSGTVSSANNRYLCYESIWSSCAYVIDTGHIYGGYCCASPTATSGSRWKLISSGLTEVGKCADGYDNDCDGLKDAADSDCPCTNGATQACTTTDGCTGTKTCSGTTWGSCTKTNPLCPSPDLDAALCIPSADVTSGGAEMGIAFGAELFNDGSNFGTPNCCGNNASEYYMCYKIDGQADCDNAYQTPACCDQSTDCIMFNMCYNHGETNLFSLCQNGDWKVCAYSSDIGKTHGAYCCAISSSMNNWKLKAGLHETTWGTCLDGLDNDCDGLKDGADSDC
ncbi:MAG: hypothetical protein V1911_00115 [Candidatus Micrarchaeota archaeon]